MSDRSPSPFDGLPAKVARLTLHHVLTQLEDFTKPGRGFVEEDEQGSDRLTAAGSRVLAYRVEDLRHGCELAVTADGYAPGNPAPVAAAVALMQLGTIALENASDVGGLDGYGLLGAMASWRELARPALAALERLEEVDHG